MEFQVRHVGGIETCFVTLPIQFIETLQSTRPANSSLPSPLILELIPCSPSPDLHSWTVSWSGAASRSFSAIEIDQKFAECISLPDRVAVRVRVVQHALKAKQVMIEPLSEDDWEVVQHKSVVAEDILLHQIRIVHENMRFPLWLHGHSATTYVINSTFPTNAVVQLDPGCEVAVAPKQRYKETKSHDVALNSMGDKCTAGNVLFRLQDSDGKMLCKADVKGFQLNIGLSTVAYLHPETANKFSLAASQLVLVVPKVSLNSRKNGTSRMTRSYDTEDPHEASVDQKNDPRHCIVRLMLSETVAKGHLMILASLRLYLKAALHSWVFVKACSVDPVDDISILSLSPCYMKAAEQDNASKKNDGQFHDDSKFVEKLPGSTFASYLEKGNLFRYDETIAARNLEPQNLINENESSMPDDGLLPERLLMAWLLAQCDVFNSFLDEERSILLLGKETMLYFSVENLMKEAGKNICFPGSSEFMKHAKKNNKPFELIFLLTVNATSSQDGGIHLYKVCFDRKKDHNSIDTNLTRKLRFENLVSFSFQEKETSMNDHFSSVSSLHWMGATVSDLVNRLMFLLSPELGMRLDSYNLPLPGHVLIYGPHGSGKTILAKAVGNYFEKHKDILAHIVFVRCSVLSVEKASSIRHALSGYISEALDHAPSLVIFDDLDSILPSSKASEGSQPLANNAALTNFLIELIDDYMDKSSSSCGWGPMAFIASVQTLESIPQALTSAGRFDFHVQLPVLATAERSAILKHEISRRSLECSDEIVRDVASKCDGYDAYDLETLVDRSVHAAIARYMPHPLSESHENSKLIRDDFSRALLEYVPVAMRDVTKAALDDGRSGWDDVGGLTNIQNGIKEMIELPSRFPEIFSQSPLRMRSNVLLYGPPGCGKTHIVGTAAAACSLRFISVKGPELLNKYIGASEQAVRDIFSKAAAAAPCILFFDEFDSIAPKRGHDNTGVTDRVVNQFLTELDGVEVLTGVFVFAATSRPDLLDAALLRPGRLDRLLFCDFPSVQDRLDILLVLSRKLPLSPDVELETIAAMTEGFSGADLQALLSDAQLAAVHEHLNVVDAMGTANAPLISDAILKSIASKARPSISDSERKKLYGIYGQFLDSKRSIATQSRDAKGKRATLA